RGTRTPGSVPGHLTPARFAVTVGKRGRAARLSPRPGYGSLNAVRRSPATTEVRRMTQPAPPAPPSPIVYPESDGLPMADNTKQLRWIFVLYGNLAALYRDARDVFVGSNQFWYPVEGEPEIRIAPDVYVVFGRPKGDRSSYQQWREADVPM